jgi:cytidylate kinase
MYSLDKSDKPNSSNLTTLFAPIMHYLQIGEDPQHIIPSLKTESCAGVASKMSQRPEIRHGVNTAIRLLEGNVVIDGRDTTTVIYPNADVKLFVTADVTTRAHRRMLEDSRVQTAQESNNPQEPLLQQYIYAVKERDANDTLRAIAPLRQAIDALLLDTSGLTIEQMCDAALSLVRSRLKI